MAEIYPATEKVPHYSNLLECLDLQAQGAENTADEGERRRQGLPDKRAVVTVICVPLGYMFP